MGLVMVSCFSAEAYTDDGTADNWAYESVHADAAAAYGCDGTGVRIAILDTGVRESHEVFQAAGSGTASGTIFIEGIDYTGTPLGGTRDYIGHGTFIASILAAQPENSLGITGIAPGAELVPMKCFDKEDASVSVLTQAIYDAADIYECDIIHMSWGTESEDDGLLEAVEYAYEKGCILVASAGNDGNSAEFYPAAWPQVISVGAADRDFKRTGFSQQNSQTLILAPGSGIAGAGHTSDRASCTLTGTSYAAAYVTGAAALALQAVPSLTPEAFVQVLRNSADKTEEGELFLNIEALLETLLSEYPQAP